MKKTLSVCCVIVLALLSMKCQKRTPEGVSTPTLNTTPKHLYAVDSITGSYEATYFDTIAAGPIDSQYFSYYNSGFTMNVSRVDTNSFRFETILWWYGVCFAQTFPYKLPDSNGLIKYVYRLDTTYFPGSQATDIDSIVFNSFTKTIFLSTNKYSTYDQDTVHRIRKSSRTIIAYKDRF